MYHRYSPTQNGQYRREVVPDTAPSNGRKPTPPSAPSTPPPPPSPPAQEQSRPQPTLPLHLLQNADSGDLLLLMILLLLLSDGNEDASTVALTLAIFLFLQ